jgi:hypothetical protein
VFEGASAAGASGAGDEATREEAMQEVKSIAPISKPEMTIASLDVDFFMFLLEHFRVQYDVVSSLFATGLRLKCEEIPFHPPISWDRGV